MINPAGEDRWRAFFGRRMAEMKARRPLNRQFEWGMAWLEIGLLLAWASWVGRAYLNLDPQRWPTGGDFALNVQAYFPLSLLAQCGACGLWNGYLNGGLPLFAEILGAVAHPVVAGLVVVFGVINGLKLATVAALFVAGLAQWRLAQVMRLGTVARLWSAALVVVAGHLAGRMENGLVEVALSTAFCSLTLALALDLALTGRRRAAVGLGVSWALALLSGQGYLQIGMCLSIFPALLVLLTDERLRGLRPVWKEFMLSAGLAVLLTAVLWVPFLHFFPGFTKPTDQEFSAVQPLAFQPLNLVIRSRDFFYNETLHKLGWPHLSVNYVGWVPILLLPVAFRLVPPARRRLLLFWLAAIGLVYLASSGVTLRFIRDIAPAGLGDQVTSLRFPSEIAGLAVPCVLALAAWGLDGLIKAGWPSLTLNVPAHAPLAISTKVLVLTIPLLWAVRSAYDFGQQWLTTSPPPEEYFRLVPQFQSATVRWLEPPNGDWPFVVEAEYLGLKLANTYRPWTWSGREAPPVAMRVTRDQVDPAIPPQMVSTVDSLNVITYADAYYASVSSGDQRTPCTAQARGGDIDVECQVETAGVLTVYENNWSGWSVRRDGGPAVLLVGNWLSTTAPAGRHRYQFRYRPWDVPLGLILTAAGCVVALGLWLKAKPDAAAPAGQGLAG